MRIVFAGTPEFAAAALQSLIEAGHHIPLVLTQPDRPAGRGMKLLASPVKQLAERLGLSVHQPAGLRDPHALQPVLDARPDVLVVAAYGLILPPELLGLGRHGALNIHASLLPRWRGAAPIQRAILAGDARTGITIMQMDAGLDTGPTLAMQEVAIDAADTAGTLHDKLAALGARMIVHALQELAAGNVPTHPQPAVGVTYAAKIAKREAALDWRLPAVELERKVRAFNPHPGAHAALRGTQVKVWRARPVAGTGTHGEVLAASDAGILVACGAGQPGALELLELQRAGGKRLSAAAFLQGFALTPGERFDPVDAA
ncbi:MAG: methionyl-tRNA formyltransferase [Betaproteobacteria bacterium]|nr:methionyl-tRNA formyltransferase [Betaproteobacteria bacterium]